MRAWYNENDPFPAAWLRNLIAAGHLPEGVVDERSIADLAPEDCPPVAHFFAGIGGWPYALRLAGWPDGAPVWTGSCPCQPFSSAGSRLEHADERHLWPAWFRLIRERRPGVVFGEQVAGPAGERWLDAVQADMEAEGYAFGSVELCAAGVGAPHRRQRLYWVADAERGAAERLRLNVAGLSRPDQGGEAERERVRDDSGDGGEFGGVGDADRTRRAQRAGLPRDDGKAPGAPPREAAIETGASCGLGNASREQTRRAGLARQDFWRPCDWLPCRDGKSRPVEPGTFPLAYGVPGRVGRVRGYGNAIVPQVAAEFVMAFMESREPLSRGGG